MGSCEDDAAPDSAGAPLLLLASPTAPACLRWCWCTCAAALRFGVKGLGIVVQEFGSMFEGLGFRV